MSEPLVSESSESSAFRVAMHREAISQRATAPGLLRAWTSLAPQPPVVLKEVVAIIRPGRWTETKAKLRRLRVPACTHQRVLGRGRERGLRYLPRHGAAGATGVRYLPKRMISWMVEASQVEPLIQALTQVNRTGSFGDGTIFVLPIEQAIRIRTNERHAEAIRSEHPLDMVVGTPQDMPAASEVVHAARQ